MDNIVDAADPTLSEAFSALAEMESDGSTTTAPAQPTSDSANPAPPAPEQTNGDVPKPPDSEAESGTPTTAADPAVSADPKAVDDKGKSKYAKSQERLHLSWDSHNKEKAEFRRTADLEQAQLKQERARFLQEQRAFQAEQAKAQAQHKPEDYEQYAAKCEAEAASIEAQAAKLESEGKYEEAQELRAQSKYQLRQQAKNAREQAAWLRANPPKAAQSSVEQQAQFESEKKEWYGKAAIDFPATAKQGSPESMALQALLKEKPAILEAPEQMYWACRLVTAETSAKAAAVSVPKLTKERDDALAKIKELQENLAVPADGGVAAIKGALGFEQKSESEQFAELTQMAQGMPS